MPPVGQEATGGPMPVTGTTRESLLTAVSFLRARPGADQWQELYPEIPAETVPEERKRIEQAAESIRKELSEYLHSVLSTPNLIVLAGSGASLGKAGGPSMSDLWARVSTLPNFQKAKTAVKHPAEDQWIENLLSSCRIAKRFLDSESAEIVAKFLAAAEWEIVKACSEFLPKADLVGHQTFLKRMARRRLRAPRLKLFTTNYDRCFEIAAASLGIILLDGFSFIEPRRFSPRMFSYDIVRRARGSEIASDFVEGVIQYFKLHGSVNWDTTEDGIIQTESPTSPCLIFPSSEKYEQSYSQPYLELMAQFQSALREPNTCLVTIGFGYGDDHLTGPIMSAVDSNPSLRLLAVDSAAREKSSNTKAVFSHLLERIERGESDICLVNAEFAQFAEMIPQLRALSPAEQIERSVRQIASKR